MYLLYSPTLVCTCMPTFGHVVLFRCACVRDGENTIFPLFGLSRRLGAFPSGRFLLVRAGTHGAWTHDWRVGPNEDEHVNMDLYVDDGKIYLDPTPARREID